MNFVPPEESTESYDFPDSKHTQENYERERYEINNVTALAWYALEAISRLKRRIILIICQSERSYRRRGVIVGEMNFFFFWPDETLLKDFGRYYRRFVCCRNDLQLNWQGDRNKTQFRSGSFRWIFFTFRLKGYTRIWNEMCVKSAPRAPNRIFSFEKVRVVD